MSTTSTWEEQYKASCTLYAYSYKFYTNNPESQSTYYGAPHTLRELVVRYKFYDHLSYVYILYKTHPRCGRPYSHNRNLLQVTGVLNDGMLRGWYSCGKAEEFYSIVFRLTRYNGLVYVIGLLFFLTKVKGKVEYY